MREWAGKRKGKWMREREGQMDEEMGKEREGQMDEGMGAVSYTHLTLPTTILV